MRKKGETKRERENNSAREVKRNQDIGDKNKTQGSTKNARMYEQKNKGKGRKEDERQVRKEGIRRGKETFRLVNKLEKRKAREKRVNGLKRKGGQRNWN